MLPQASGGAAVVPLVCCLLSLRGQQDKGLIMAEQYDVIAIGGGSGGLAAAQRAAEYGARALIIERDDILGGTCVNVGCVPKKVMWHAADLAQAFRDAPAYGFENVVPKHDWSALVQRREAYINRLNGIYERNLDNRNVDWISGNAVLTGSNQVTIGDKEFTAPHIIIATGGEPVVPDLPGADLGITSDGFFALTDRPQKVAIVGSGYIAVELAGVLSSLGSDVELFARYDSVLRAHDEMLQQGALIGLAEHGVVIRLGTPAGAFGHDTLHGVACDRGDFRREDVGGHNGSRSVSRVQRGGRHPSVTSEYTKRLCHLNWRDCDFVSHSNRGLRIAGPVSLARHDAAGFARYATFG